MCLKRLIFSIIIFVVTLGTLYIKNNTRGVSITFKDMGYPDTFVIPIVNPPILLR